MISSSSSTSKIFWSRARVNFGKVATLVISKQPCAGCKTFSRIVLKTKARIKQPSYVFLLIYTQVKSTLHSDYKHITKNVQLQGWKDRVCRIIGYVTGMRGRQNTRYCLLRETGSVQIFLYTARNQQIKMCKFCRANVIAMLPFETVCDAMVESIARRIADGGSTITRPETISIALKR